MVWKMVHQRHVKVAQCDLQSCMNNISLASKRLAHCRRGVHDLRKSIKNTDFPPLSSYQYFIVSPPQPARAFPSIGYLPHTQVCCEETSPLPPRINNHHTKKPNNAKAQTQHPNRGRRNMDAACIADCQSKNRARQTCCWKSLVPPGIALG